MFGATVNLDIEAVTSHLAARGMGAAEMKQMGNLMLRALRAAEDPAELAKLREETKTLCNRFPVPGLEGTSASGTLRSASM